jgi:Ca-activated chloride channel family protein
MAPWHPLGILLVAVPIALLTTLALPAQPPQGPTFITGTKVVSLFVTVADAQKRLVPDLTKDDFEIFDNEKPQTIIHFDNSVQPITVVMMLDTSSSMTLSIDLLKQAAEQFLIRLLPDDKGKVGAFNDKVQISARFTNDRDELVGATKDLDYGNGTRLWDALGMSLDELKGIDGRKVILVFTDGDDTSSKIGQGTVVDRARAEEVMVYAIGLESQFLGVNGRMVRTRPDRGLRKIADETGGGYFELEKTADLAPTFTKVAQELRTQYIIGFMPAQLDGRVHKLSVKVKQAGLTARTRRSYLAAAEKTTAGLVLEK